MADGNDHEMSPAPMTCTCPKPSLHVAQMEDDSPEFATEA